MAVNFCTLFTVTIEHTYYNQNCRDFSFIIPADTTRLLKSGKLIAKVREGKLYVLFEADETETALVSVSGKTLRFGLKLLNPFFSNFTDFTDFNFNSATPIYRNATNPNNLELDEKLTLVGQVFSHSLVNTARPVVVTLKDAHNQILQQNTITEQYNRSTVSYDLTGLAVGNYTVEESYPGSTETTTYYFDAELQQQGIFGVIEIKIDNSFYSTAANFEIAFDAKEETLKYYVITNKYNEEDLKQLCVSDKGFEEDERTEVKFTKLVLPEDFTAEEIPAVLLGHGEEEDDPKVVLFKSQTVVARQEKARKNIQLQKQKNGDVEELIEHLPQPSFNKANSDLIIQLAKPKP